MNDRTPSQIEGCVFGLLIPAFGLLLAAKLLGELPISWWVVFSPLLAKLAWLGLMGLRLGVSKGQVLTDAAPDSPAALARQMAKAYAAALAADPALTHRDLMRAALESQVISATEEAIEETLATAGEDIERLVQMIARAQNQWGVRGLARDFEELELNALAGDKAAMEQLKRNHRAMVAMRDMIREELDRHLPASAPRSWKAGG